MAKNKVKRGFFGYLLIFLGFALGILCILTVVLVFNPGKDVYGIGLRFVAHNHAYEIYKAENTNAYFNNFSAVNFESKYANFNIKNDNTVDNFKVVVSPKISAFSKTEATGLSVGVTHANGVLNISVTEPNLWFSLSSKIDVTLIVPCTDYAKGYNVMKNADLTITTQSGSITLGDDNIRDTYYAKNATINSNNGRITVKNNIKLTDGALTINTKTSAIIASAGYVSNQAYISNLTINNTSGKIDIGRVPGNLTLNAIGKVEAQINNVYGDLEINSKNGYVNIKNLQGSLYAANNLELTNIIVGTIDGNIALETTAGDITVEKLIGEAEIETTSGHVKINEANNQINIRTTSGNVYVVQKSNDLTEIFTESGKITVKLYEVGNVVLNTQKSSIDLSVKAGKTYVLDYQTKNGMAASWVTESLEKSGVLLVGGAAADSDLKIDADAPNGRINAVEF